MRRSILLALAASVAVCGMSTMATRADSVLYNLGVSNFPVTSGNYGTVTVDRVSTTVANLTFTAANGYSFVDGGAVAANINATSWTVTSLTGTQGSSFYSWLKNGDPISGNEDGFGSFNQQIDSNNASDLSATISFTVTRSSGSWGAAADVLTGNPGYFVAAHVFNPNANNGKTGFAADVGGPNRPPDAVPLPAAVWSGISLLGLLGVGSRLRKKARV